MLTKQQRDLLARMRADNLASPPPFRTLGHWEKVGDKFDTWFEELGIGDVINQRYNEHFSGEPRRVEATEGFLDYMTRGEWRDSRKLARMVLEHKLPESLSRGGMFAEHALRHVMKNPSWGVLTAIDAMASIMKGTGGGSEKLIDIGAGWGRIGYVFQKLFCDMDYIICDLPESLLISYSYLPVMLPSSFHCHYDRLDYDPDLRIRYDGACYYLPTHRILDLPDKSADVIVNIASFQEMTDEYVDMYFDIIDKKGRFLYTLQRGHPDRRPKCPSKPHWKLLFSRHPLWSDRYYEAMFEL